jgi:hypothetical protein
MIELGKLWRWYFDVVEINKVSLQFTIYEDYNHDKILKFS